jgi:hypothetical protein
MLSSIREVAGENPLRPCAASLIFLFSRPFAIPFLRSLRLLAIGYWLPAILSRPDPDLVQMDQQIGWILIHPISTRTL